LRRGQVGVKIYYSPPLAPIVLYGLRVHQPPLELSREDVELLVPVVLKKAKEHGLVLAE
jgi:hypothetical protein